MAGLVALHQDGHHIPSLSFVYVCHTRPPSKVPQPILLSTAKALLPAVKRKPFRKRRLLYPTAKQKNTQSLLALLAGGNHIIKAEQDGRDDDGHGHLPRHSGDYQQHAADHHEDDPADRDSEDAEYLSDDDEEEAAVLSQFDDATTVSTQRYH